MECVSLPVLWWHLVGYAPEGGDSSCFDSPPLTTLVTPALMMPPEPPAPNFLEATL